MIEFPAGCGETEASSSGQVHVDVALVRRSFSLSRRVGINYALGADSLTKS